MARPVLALLLIGLATAGAALFWLFEIERQYQDGTLAYIKLTPRWGRSVGVSAGDDRRPPARTARPTIRIATFKLERFDEHRLGQQSTVNVLVRVIGQFEVIALQGLAGPNQSVLLRLVEQLNATGRHYGVVVCAAPDRQPHQPYLAIVYDQTAVEVDQGTVHLVGDPAKRLRHRPLVAAFRVRGLPPEQAFTFTLINVDVDPQRAAGELDALAEVFRAVRDDGRNEDDIIMLGHFAADQHSLGRLGQVPNLLAALTTLPSTVRGVARVDNLLMDRLATVEYTTRNGVVDLMRQFDLTLAAAQSISEHLPVWAEFSSYEKGLPVR